MGIHKYILLKVMALVILTSVLVNCGKQNKSEVEKNQDPITSTVVLSERTNAHFKELKNLLDQGAEISLTVTGIGDGKDKFSTKLVHTDPATHEKCEVSTDEASVSYCCNIMRHAFMKRKVINPVESPAGCFKKHFGAQAKMESLLGNVKSDFFRFTYINNRIITYINDDSDVTQETIGPHLAHPYFGHAISIDNGLILQPLDQKKNILPETLLELTPQPGQILPAAGDVVNQILGTWQLKTVITK